MKNTTKILSKDKNSIVDMEYKKKGHCLVYLTSFIIT